MSEKAKEPLFKEIYNAIQSLGASTPFSFISNKTTNKTDMNSNNNSVTEIKELAKTNLSIKTIKALKLLDIYNTDDLNNIDILQLYKIPNIIISTNMVDELLNFLIDNNINFINCNNNYTRINSYDISPALKKALYKIGYFYIENLKNVDLNIFSTPESCPTSLIDDLIDLLTSNNIEFIQKKENYEFIKKYNLSSPSKSVLYRTNHFYKEDLSDIDIKTLFNTYNCGPAVINELLTFLDKNDIPYLQHKENAHKLMDYNFPYETLNVFYKNNYYFYEDIENLKISEINNLSGIFPKIIDNIIDFAIKNNLKNFIEYKDTKRINSFNITPATISALYKAGVYFTTDKINLNTIINVNPNIAPKTIEDIKQLKQLLEQDTNHTDNKPKRIPWDKYQVALLIYIYFKIENNELSHSEGVSYLSSLFRDNAKKNNIDIDDTYRNESGIGMCLEHIRYLYTNGSKGLSNFSNVEKTVVDMQKEYPELYKKVLSEAKEEYRINLSNVEANNQDININKTEQNIESLTIDDLNLSTKVTNCLKAFNIYNLKDLLSINLSAFKKQRNVGKNTIAEVESILKQYLKQEDIEANSKNFDLENKKDFDSESISNDTYYTTIDKIPESYYLSVSDVFDDEWILKYCNKFNLKNVGLLVNKFPDIFINSDEIMIQDIYFEKENIIKSKLNDLGITQYPIFLSLEQLSILNKRTVKECFKVNYEQELYQEVINILKNIQDQNSDDRARKKQRNKILTEREILILQKRNGINCQKETLEVLGATYGLTRERIRQIEKKALNKIKTNLSTYFSQVNSELDNIFNTFGKIFYNGLFFNLSDKELIETVLSSINDKIFDINYDYNIVHTPDFDINEMVASIIKQVESDGDNFIKKDDLINFISDELKKYTYNNTEEQKIYFNNLLQYISQKIIDTQFIYLENDLYKYRLAKSSFAGKDKNELLSFYFEKLYKNPVNIPQRNETALKQNLSELYKACPFLNEYDGTTTIERLIKTNKDIIFYGMGKYIHINNTNVNLQFVDSIIVDILKLFSQGKKEVSPAEIYNSHSYEYKNENIPNEYALIGLIQYRNPKNIVCDIRRMLLLPSGRINVDDYVDKDILDDINPETIEKLQNTLSKFIQGLRINMINISINRFKSTYQDLYNEECTLSNEKIIDILQKIGINYNGVIFAPQNLIDEELSTSIKNYIDNIFLECNILYIDCIYKHFEEEFIGTKIDSSGILYAYLKSVYNSNYYVTKEYIATDINASASPVADIKKYLLDEKTPKNKEELYNYFYNYSENSIDYALSSDKEIITNKQNQEYFHYLAFNINNHQLNTIKNIIDNAINADGYITGTSLYEIIEKEHSDIILQNSFMTTIGLRKSIAILLEDDFTFNGNIISAVSNSTSATDIFRKFLEKHNEFTYDNINELSVNIGRPCIPWDMLFNTHIRINEDTFCKVDKNDFNIELIDKCLDSICQSTFTPIKKISFFDTFPSCKYTWNSYLLESYVNCLSEEFKLISTGFAKISTNGIIVRKHSTINNINDLLIEVISTYNENCSNKIILENLKRDGYIIRARIDNLEELKIKAQEIRNKRRIIR